MGAINHLDAVKPNGYSQTEKIRWLSTLDGIVKAEIIDNHEIKVEFVENKTTGKLDLYVFDKLIDSFDVIAKGEYKSEKTGLIFTDKQKMIEAACAFNGYTENTALTTELLIPHPYDEVYIRWLESQIDYANGEYGKYNNSMAMYNTAYVAFQNYYNRTHMPIGKKFKFF
jgi:hypothetical protein